MASYLEVIKGRISIFNILMRSSPGKEKYCFSCTWSRGTASAARWALTTAQALNVGNLPPLSSVPRQQLYLVAAQAPMAPRTLPLAVPYQELDLG